MLPAGWVNGRLSQWPPTIDRTEMTDHFKTTFLLLIVVVVLLLLVVLVTTTKRANISPH